MITQMLEGQQKSPPTATTNNMSTASPMTLKMSNQRRGRTRTRRRGGFSLIVIVSVATLLVASLSGLHWIGIGGLLCSEAVSVQRLTVPDLVVVDQLGGQLNQPSHSSSSTLASSSAIAAAAAARVTPPQDSSGARTHSGNLTISHHHQQQQQPEAASLINNQDLSPISGASDSGQQQQQLTFECLISYDRKKDKNLIIKWHHDDRVEPIYQWIVELDKISIAPQYRPYILANNSTQSSRQQQQQQLLLLSGGAGRANHSSTSGPATNQSIQLLEASFRLIRPSKELGGKYTCSAISVQNDDSKWRKMIVFTPPRSFKFNATRTDFGAGSQQSLLSSPWAANSRHTTTASNLPTGANQQPAATSTATTSTGANELPLAYRSRGFDSQPASTLSPQMYKTVDYVNVRNPNYRPPPPPPAAQSSTGGSNSNPLLDTRQQQRRLMAANGPTPNSNNGNGLASSRYSGGVKLVCDIDQIFPVPEVSIYRLAMMNNNNSSSSSSQLFHHPMEKLTKSETRIEKNPLNGLYHIQVISVLLDDEIELKYGSQEPVYFECLIGLTNLELSKYSDNKRSLVYRPSSSSSSWSSSSSSSASSQQRGMQNDIDTESDRSAASGAASKPAAVYLLLMMNSLLFIWMMMMMHTTTTTRLGG